MTNPTALPQVRPDPQIPESKEVVRLPDGRVVQRTTFTSGNVQDTAVFPGDYPDAKKVKE